MRQGKNRKDRVVPIGERALAWIAKYLDEARPHLVASPEPPHSSSRAAVQRRTSSFLL